MPATRSCAATTTPMPRSFPDEGGWRRSACENVDGWTRPTPTRAPTRAASGCAIREAPRSAQVSAEDVTHDTQASPEAGDQDQEIAPDRITRARATRTTGSQTAMRRRLGRPGRGRRRDRRGRDEPRRGRRGASSANRVTDGVQQRALHDGPDDPSPAPDPSSGCRRKRHDCRPACSTRPAALSPRRESCIPRRRHRLDVRLVLADAVANGVSVDDRDQIAWAGHHALDEHPRRTPGAPATSHGWVEPCPEWPIRIAGSCARAPAGGWNTTMSPRPGGWGPHRRDPLAHLQRRLHRPGRDLVLADRLVHRQPRQRPRGPPRRAGGGRAGGGRAVRAAVPPEPPGCSPDWRGAAVSSRGAPPLPDRHGRDRA